MNSTAYFETSIIGYLTSRPSRDLITAANQQLTRDWWEAHRERYDIYVSQAVVAECSVGDPQAAEERLEAIGDIPVLDVTEAAEQLAEQLLKQVPLPQHAQVDALHIAVAAVHGINFLLTWNCAHIANAVLQPSIEAICRTAGFDPPTICTPQQLMES